MKRGIRQECPVSALLFILVAENLAINKQTNNEIQGLKLNENSDKIYQIVRHADDCKNMVKEPSSLKKLQDTIECFSKEAGPKLNSKYRQNGI